MLNVCVLCYAFFRLSLSFLSLVLAFLYSWFPNSVLPLVVSKSIATIQLAKESRALSSLLEENGLTDLPSASASSLSVSEVCNL